MAIVIYVMESEFKSKRLESNNLQFLFLEKFITDSMESRIFEIRLNTLK